jgi:ATP-binding cassette subfamily C protein LapB
MTRAPAVTSPAAPPPAPPAAQRLVAWLAAHHRQPFSSAALRGALPEGFDPRDPAMLSRALAAVGLKSRLVLRSLKQVDPAVLPAVVFAKGGTPLILLRLSRDRRIATVVDPATGGLEREEKRRRLARRIGPEMLLVAPAGDRAESRLAPETRAAGADRRHWFWGPVRDNWGGWLQVMLAALAANLLALALPLFVMNVYDRVIPNLAYVTLWTLAAGVGLALLLDLAVRALRAGVLERIGRRVDGAAAATLFRHALNVRMLDRPGGAAGVASHFRDFDAVREFFASATFVSVIDLLFIGVFLGVLYMIVGELAFVALAAVPLVLVIALLAQLPMGGLVRRAQQMAGKRHVVLVETLLGIETVKSLNAEPVMQREWESAVSASSRVNGRSRVWAGFATSSTVLIQQAVSVLTVVWGVFLIAEGAITVGGLIAANILAGRALAPLASIAATVTRAQYAMRAMGALSRFMQLPAETGPEVRSSLRVTDARLELKGVSYSYPAAEVPALREVSLSVAPGETLALLGRVGSGKTTLGKLLCGLLAHERGQILVDGQALGQYEPAELRDGIGYLPQDPELFTGTLRENLVIGRPEATDAEIERALHLAGMERYVAEQPEGLGFFVGEKGCRLSGGQRQGLALARLLLRRPRLLFLDEPTNAMDQEMEGRVVARLAELSAAGTGMILCTHRQSLAAIAPRFVVMDAGRVVLDGPQAEVIERLRRPLPARRQAG